MNRFIRASRRPALAASTCMAMALCAAAAYAAEPATGPASKPAPGAKPAATPKKTKDAPPANLLTRNELRACMAQDTKLKGLREDALRQHTELEKDKTAVQSEGAALKQALETLDRTSEPAINDYKARVQAHDALIEAYNAKLPGFNTVADALRGEEAAYAKNCAGRPFEEGDELAIKRAKK